MKQEITCPLLQGLAESHLMKCIHCVSRWNTTLDRTWEAFNETAFNQHPKMGWICQCPPSFPHGRDDRVLLCESLFPHDIVVNGYAYP